MSETAQDYRWKAVGWGLVYTPLCVRKDVDPVAAAAEYTVTDPPGTAANEWVYVTPDEVQGDESLRSQLGETYPIPCSENPDTHHHVVVGC